MTETMGRVPAEDLTRAVARIFLAAGGSAEEAERIARDLVAANLAGHDSHGVIRTERYLMWLERGVLNFDRHVESVIDGPAFALLDANHGFGQTVGPEAVTIGIAKAREHGLSVVALRRAGHLGRIGGLAEIACREGLISIHFVNVANSVLVAPFGGAARRMSTAPFCVGIPQEGGDFVLDFATSKVAEGKVLVARKARRPAPPDSLVGPDGMLSDDPDLLYGPAAPGQVENPRSGPGALVAMGDHKGSGLALACELLAGALTGSGTAEQGSDRSHNGMLSIYVDPEHLDDGHGWSRAVAAYIEEVRACPPADPDAPVLVPGDPERRRRADRLAYGVPLDPDVWESLLRAGERHGVPRETLAGMVEKGPA
jgi:uncharacterized oxidoreductase